MAQDHITEYGEKRDWRGARPGDYVGGPANSARNEATECCDSSPTVTALAEQTNKTLWGAIAEADNLLHHLVGPQPTAGCTAGGEAIGKDASLSDLQRSNTILANRLLSQLMAIRERL